MCACMQRVCVRTCTMCVFKLLLDEPSTKTLCGADMISFLVLISCHQVEQASGKGTIIMLVKGNSEFINCCLDQECCDNGLSHDTLILLLLTLKYGI